MRETSVEHQYLQLLHAKKSLKREKKSREKMQSFLNSLKRIKVIPSMSMRNRSKKTTNSDVQTWFYFPQSAFGKFEKERKKKLWLIVQQMNLHRKPLYFMK
jgi:hypothetical protein